MSRHADTSRRGFILVMMLMLLAIAAVALASVGRSSMGLAVDALRARQDLQRRWGSISTRHATLQLAPILLDQASGISDPLASLQVQITLSGLTYTLTVSDEQAKANVNKMLFYQGRETTRTFIRRQCDGQPWADEITLPTNKSQSPGELINVPSENRRNVISFNHFLPGFDPRHLANPQDFSLDTLTCWGDGRINLTRASDDLVQDVLKPLLTTSEIARIRESLASSADSPLIDSLNNAGISEKDRSIILRRLAQDSSCYSVWTAVDNGKRSWHELAVIELQPDSSPEPQPAEASEVDENDPDSDADTDEELSTLTTPVVPDETAPVTEDDPETSPNDYRDEYPRLYLYQW